MDLFKLATKQKLTYKTNKGFVTTEQLWDMSIDELDQLAISLEIEHKQSGKKSFIYKTAPKDKIAKLRFEVVLDVLNTLNEEREAAQEALRIKRENEKIYSMVAEIEEDELKEKLKKMSPAERQRMLG